MHSCLFHRAIPVAKPNEVDAGVDAEDDGVDVEADDVDVDADDVDVDVGAAEVACKRDTSTNQQTDKGVSGR